MSELDFFRHLQKRMDEQAHEVWEMVKYSRETGGALSLGEVTLTELNFYALRDVWSKSVYVKTDEPIEAKTGADWEWLIGHDDTWVALRVQAKVLGSGSEKRSFVELAHPNRTGGQMDLIIDPLTTTTVCRWMPLYVFYAAEPPVTPGTIGSRVNAAAPWPSGREPGCSAVSALAVRQRASAHRTLDAKGDWSGPWVKRADRHLPHAIHWSDIFSGLVERLENHESMDDIVASLAHEKFPRGEIDIARFWDAECTDGPCNAPLPALEKEIVREGADDFTQADVVSIKVLTTRGEQAKKAREEARKRQATGDTPPSLERFEDLAVEAGPRELDDSEAPERVVDLRSLGLGAEDEQRVAALLPSMVSVIDLDHLKW